MSITFEAWPKTPRLFRDMVITEKIDGTNAAVIVEADGDGGYTVGAQSRKRLITPADDNFGFAAWVYDNAEDLARLLGPGRHFGEWWGSGIQRGYGLTTGEKRFSLFNVGRYTALLSAASADGLEIPGVDIVPMLHTGPFDLEVVGSWLETLRTTGSVVAPGFMRPEGVVVYHTAARQVFKALLENDDKPKGEAA